MDGGNTDRAYTPARQHRAEICSSRLRPRRYWSPRDIAIADIFRRLPPFVITIARDVVRLESRITLYTYPQPLAEVIAAILCSQGIWLDDE
jgi:hypothetical protein